MKKIAFTNHKGGVGKTACSMAFAAGLDSRGYKVLLVDLDQQMNATQAAGIDTEGKASVFDLLTSDDCKLRDVIVPYRYGDILPGDRLMIGAEQKMRDLLSPNTRLNDILKELDPESYDFVVIDCPPSLGYVTTNAMVAADELVVVVQSDHASITGVGNVYELKQRIASAHLNEDLEIAGILRNFYDGNRVLSKSADSALPELASDCGSRLFESRIRSCEAIKQAQARAMSIFDYAPTCNAVRDFNALIDEYLSL